MRIDVLAPALKTPPMQYKNLGHSRWVRLAMWVVGVTVAVWVLAWLAVPPLLKQAIEKTATQRLGRTVQLQQVDFRPWSLELTLHGLRVAQAGGGPDLLQIRHIYIDAELQSLLRLAPVVDAVRLDEPQLRVTHLGAGRYDFDDILARLQGPAESPAGEPQRFALHNLQILAGAIDYTDAAVQRTHTLRELQLSIPFLSNLNSHREIKVQPQLAFVLNGSRFDSTALGTPFAQTRKTDASIRIAGFNLAPYLGYLPAGLPVRLQSAVLDAELRVAFEQLPAPAVRVGGSLTARGVRLATADAAPLLGFDALTVQLGDVRPLERVVGLQAVELTGPRLDVRRSAQGRLNLDMGTGTSTQPGSATTTQPAWRLSVERLAVRDGVAAWEDRSVSPRSTMTLAGFTLDASAIQWPLVQPLQFSGAAAVASRPPQATLTFAGSATTAAASATVSVSQLGLGTASPYVAQFLRPALTGSLSSTLGVTWRAAQGRGDADVQVHIVSLMLDGLSLADPDRRPAGAPLAAVRQLALADAHLDLTRSTLGISKLQIEQPRLAASRDAQGRFMTQAWLKPPPASAVAGTATATGNPWRVTLDNLAVNGGQVGWRDEAMRKPVALDVSALQIKGSNLVLPSARDAAPVRTARPASLNVSARLAAGQTEPGKLSYQGTVGLLPLQAQGAVDVTHLPVHALAPYLGDALNLELLRADAAFRGTLRFEAAPGGTTLRLAGDAALEDLRANSLPAAGTAGFTTGEELLAWTSLNLGGLDVSVAPGTATMISVRETSLSDFYARIIINEAGRINLQDLGRQGAAQTAGTPTAVATASSAAPAPASPAPVIRIGPVSLVNGKVFFSDRFIKPSYSANLSELTGRLSGFSSVAAGATPEMADLSLRGKAEGTADLEITGKLNPLAQPLALDIRGRMRDLELPPLSPYSVKYAGHGIQRGKLSMDVNYVVRPDGQLTASNRLVLNQLSFGDKVDGAPASLPVKLAVALLADRNGVIDVDLPISGSLNDPQFRLGPLIFRVIVNLVVKAVTAPFSLLASALGGGGEELSMVSFAPGSAILSPDARAGLDKVARALTDRPALRMTVVGTASLEAERQALRDERLAALLRAEKRRAAGLAATAVVTLDPAEEPALLAAVYRRADITKPRNLIGLARDLPPAEMRALLLANITVDENAARELAVQRGVAVRDYLAGRDLSAQRLFLGAAKAVGPEAKWSPRAELNLAMQ